MVKHLEKAFAGTGCVHERGGEVDTGAGDTQLASGLDMKLSMPPLVSERQRIGWEGNLGD